MLLPIKSHGTFSEPHIPVNCVYIHSPLKGEPPEGSTGSHLRAVAAPRTVLCFIHGHPLRNICHVFELIP